MTAPPYAPECEPAKRNLELWAELPLTDYIARHQRSNGLTIFQHIHKTAGSSMVAELQKHVDHYYSLHNDFSRYTSPALNYDTLIPSLRAEMHTVIDQALVRYQPGQVRVMSGHIYHDHIDRLLAVFPDALFFTFLRSPVARVVSDFRYQSTPAHPPHEAFRRACPTIEHYLDRDDEMDKMFEFLAGRDRSLEDAIARIEKYYILVGIQEMYPMSFNILMRLHGRSAFPSEHVRKTQDMHENKVELTPELRARIEARNPKDVALYNHFLAKMRARRGEWQALRAAGGAAN